MKNVIKYKEYIHYYYKIVIYMQKVDIKGCIIMIPKLMR